MPVSDYHDFMLPLLRIAAARKDETFRLTDIIEEIAVSLNLSEYELYELLPGGTEIKFRYRLRLHWACNDLYLARLLSRPRRDLFKITKRGLDAIGSNPKRIDRDFLLKYPEFSEHHRISKMTHSRKSFKFLSDDPEKINPSDDWHIDLYDVITRTCGEIRVHLIEELLQRLQQGSQECFNRIAINLLISLGYQGTYNEIEASLHNTGNGYLEGFLKIDKLGIDSVYILIVKQAAGHTIKSAVVQKFAESLHKNRTSKGIILTSSMFSKNAVEGAKTRSHAYISLIDGTAMAELMIENNIGVSIQEVFSLKKIDESIFRG